MKKGIFAAFGVCALLAWTPGWGAGSARAQGRAGRVEVGPFVGGYVFDDDLELEDGLVVGARGGYWLNDRFLGELSLDWAPTEEEHGDGRASLFQTHADLLYHLDLGWKLEPFVAAGLGVARYDARSEGGKDWDFLLNYGVGARYWINDRIAARVDLRQPVTFGSTDFNFMYTVGLSVLLGGATPTPMAAAPTASPMPTASLAASPSSIQRGQPTTLSWSTKDATDVAMDGFGAVGESGSRSVTPTESTMYRLIAKGAGGVSEATAPVTVTVPPPPAPTAMLTASPIAVEQGQSTTLTWTTQNATDVSIEGVGAVEANGSRSLLPRDPTTYRLTARGPGGVADAATSVAVTTPLAPTATLTVNPGTVKWGEPTTLTWTSQNATDVSIDGLGAVGAAGSQSVTPNISTTYRLLANGPGGAAGATASVTVELPEKVCISLHIEFDFDKSDIKTKYHQEIGRVADFMKTYPKTTAVIEGHTDSIGAKEYNEKLSLRRAAAVVAYLADKYGIEPARLSSKGYGFSRPVADNATDEGRQKNRRIDAVIDCVVR